MTKKEIIELVRKYLSGGSETSDIMHKVDPRVIELHINNVFADVVYSVYRSEREGISLYSKTYSGQVVSQDGTTNVYYCDLPATIIQLPGVAQGVRRISLDSSSSLEFVPLDADMAEAFSGLDVSDSNINSVMGYCLRNNSRVEFINMSSDPGTLRMDLVINFSEYSDDDKIYLPSGRAQALVQAVSESLQGRPPVERKSDNLEDVIQKQ